MHVHRHLLPRESAFLDVLGTGLLSTADWVSGEQSWYKQLLVREDPLGHVMVRWEINPSISESHRSSATYRGCSRLVGSLVGHLRADR